MPARLGSNPLESEGQAAIPEIRLHLVHASQSAEQGRHRASCNDVFFDMRLGCTARATPWNSRNQPFEHSDLESAHVVEACLRCRRRRGRWSRPLFPDRGEYLDRDSQRMVRICSKHVLYSHVGSTADRRRRGGGADVAQASTKFDTVGSNEGLK